MILDSNEIRGRFEAGARVAAILDAYASDLGATPIADYAWAITTDGGTVRHLRRMTPVGLIALREEGTGPTISIRAQIVTLGQAVDIAMVRYERPGEDPFWELHVGDGNPRPVPADGIAAAFALVKAALEATARR